MLYKLRTTHGEVHSRSTKYDAVLLVDGHLTISSQVIKTALRNRNKQLQHITEIGSGYRLAYQYTLLMEPQEWHQYMFKNICVSSPHLHMH